ncbi:MAG: hypothetical protein FWF41_03905 [Betaproteobacteria bacterium]|nr:hypothetical protein [Betaproteobacteria bacterium]
MKCLTKEEANIYLGKIGMEIGEWNNIQKKTSVSSEKFHWVNHQTPKGARDLYKYAQAVADWLPRGNWKILQIDDSGGAFL